MEFIQLKIRSHFKSYNDITRRSVITEFPVSCSAISEYCLTERVRQGMIRT